MRRVRITGILIVWTSLLPAFVGCSLSGVMSHDATLITHQPAASTPEALRPTTLSARKAESQAPFVLQLSDLKPGQQVRLLTHRTSGAKGEENTIDEQTASLEMFFAADKVTGTIASADSDHIVLRDVVITSERCVDSTWNVMGWIPHLLHPSQGATLECHYTVVPGELLVPRKTIRAAQEMTAEETKHLMNAAAQNQTKYVQFDFDIGGID